MTITALALSSVEVAPATLQLGLADTQRYVATGTFADGSTRNISALVDWESSAAAIAPITATGFVSGLSQGGATLTARAGEKSGTATLTVTSKRIASLTVTPPYASITTAQTQQLTATATYTDGTTGDVTQAVTWTSSDSDYATVTATGLVSGVAAISGVSITAQAGAISSRSIVPVTTPEFALVGISFTAKTMWVGQNFPAFQVDANFGAIGSNYTAVTWSSSDPTVAAILPEGRVAALAPGVVTLTARTHSGGALLTATNTLTVTHPPLQTLNVLPATTQLAVGAQLQLAATGLYPDSTVTRDLTASAAWSSSNPAVATVTSSGRVTAVASGSATITAAAESLTGTTTVTVPTSVPPNQTVTLTPTDDNNLMYSSLVPERNSSVFQGEGMFGVPAVGVGCIWYYSPPIGFAPERIDASCSQTLLKFDLSALAGRTILSAKLVLTTSTYGVGYVPRPWFIYALASAWSGTTVTWNSSQGLQHYVYSETRYDPPIYSGQVFELDQTSTVRNWVGGTFVNQGWQLGLTNWLLPYVTTSSIDLFEFHSKEDPGGRGPKLIVTYR